MYKFYFVIIMSFMIASCTEDGIFGPIAASEKIQSGSIPSVAIGKVLHTKSNTRTSGYYFASVGTGIRYKKTSASSWSGSSISLSSNTESWDGVQSIAATDKHIFMAVFRIRGGKYSAGIQRMDSFDDSKGQVGYTSLGKVWESSSTVYHSIKIFAPEPSGDVYVNVIEHTGEYASLDTNSNNFARSELYTLTENAPKWELAKKIARQEELDGTKGSRYATAIASNGSGTVIIAAAGNILKAGKGILLNKDGEPVTFTGKIKALTLTTSSLTWLPRKWKPGKGAFIMSASKGTGSNFPIYASYDGSEWVRISGRTPKTSTFIDISDTKAGAPENERLVLSGTSSYILDSSSRAAAGYNEINMHSDDISEWSFKTSRSSYSFASKVNYASSKLSSSSITAFTILGDTRKRLFASTVNGLWSIPMDSKRPSWVQE